MPSAALDAAARTTTAADEHRCACVGSARRWFTRYTIHGARREMQLGSAHDISLKEARELVGDVRKSVKAGTDPIESKKTVQVEEAKTPSFGAFADELVGTLQSGFRNEKHIYQWKQTLGDAYCGSIRNKLIDAVTTDDILEILKPLSAARELGGHRAMSLGRGTVSAGRAIA
ncbi:MAG: Arm DNA-binding domain-containing protein [Ancalomicrobiaceae bacterium]|nr:Arm DNA-binding domain-containing protein [Ancalomicrobiaceae bacterium]